MDTYDQQILNLLQSGIALVPQPFKLLGEKVGLSEEDVLQRISTLKQDPKQSPIRQISAIFDTKTLGYSSCLVAAKVPEENLERVAQIINQHPGVTHNYKRNHEYNLWFTIAVPPTSRLGLERTVQALQKQSGSVVMRLMPTLKLFKIGVQLDMTGKEDGAKKRAKPVYSEADRVAAKKELSELHIAVIRTLQQDLPIVARPFDNWADEMGISTEELLKLGRQMIADKQMRRFAAVLNHRKAGFLFNGMGVWAVPEHCITEVGEKMATFQAVSHCYLRPTYEDWPYSIFTMVHGRSLEECEDILSAISQETQIDNYITLYSTKEYKKIRLSYFTPEIDRWENSLDENCNSEGVCEIKAAL